MKYCLDTSKKPYYDECKTAGMDEKKAIEIARFNSTLKDLLDCENAPQNLT